MLKKQVVELFASPSLRHGYRPAVLESLHIDSVAAHPDQRYEWMTATASFAIDPRAAANRRIVDLDLAPRDAQGVVRFESDVRLMRPLGGGVGKALVVVPNRGLIGSLPFSFDTPLFQDQSEPPLAGDGFLLDRGWTIAWCGWQWDVQRDEGWLGLDAPCAEVEPGWMRVEFRPDADQPGHALSDSSIFFRFTEYPTADPEDPEAVLTVRTAPMGPKTVVPRSHWRFVESTAVEVDGGFRAFHWYELIYRSALAPVVGTGLLAVRDLGAHLHRDHGHVFAYGVSQSGRLLRHLLHEGLNLDEQGQQVFHAVFSHVASARRGEFNMRYGQPGLTHPLTPAYGPPYDTTSLLQRQRALGGVPKVMFTNTSWEYWRGDGALVHQDAHTGADLPEDADARVHLLTGADHYGDVFIKDSMPVANPVHFLDVTPILRALFAQLDAWTCDGVEPAPSCVPRACDGTAVTRVDVLRTFHDCALPDPDLLPWTPAIDGAADRWPLDVGEPTVALVAAVDADGIEVAGVRLPAVAVPAFVHTGWNPRIAIDGLPNVLYEFMGSRLPLQGGSDPPDPDTYEASAREAATALAAARFLLEQDVDRAVLDALRSYDTARASGTPPGCTGRAVEPTSRRQRTTLIGEEASARPATTKKVADQHGRTPMGELDGKIAVITGAGSGMARASAEVFVREGALVLGADITGGEEETAEELGDAFVPFHADVSKEEEVEAMFAAALEAFGKVDAVLNVAGIGSAQRLADVTVEDYQRTMGVNLLGVVLGTKHAIRTMLPTGGGAIVNWSSTGGLNASQMMPVGVYSASKAGVILITKQAAVENAAQGIRANAICPGTIVTPLSGGPEGVKRLAPLIEAAPMKRPGQPEEVAELACFLASDRASYITGTAIAVDGGWTATLA